MKYFAPGGKQIIVKGGNRDEEEIGLYFD